MAAITSDFSTRLATLEAYKKEKEPLYAEFNDNYLKNSFLEGRRFSAPVMGGKFLAANGQIARLTRP